jgi:hypothetical protein
VVARTTTTVHLGLAVVLGEGAGGAVVADRGHADDGRGADLDGAAVGVRDAAELGRGVPAEAAGRAGDEGGGHGPQPGRVPDAEAVVPSS